MIAKNAAYVLYHLWNKLKFVFLFACSKFIWLEALKCVLLSWDRKEQKMNPNIKAANSLVLKILVVNLLLAFLTAFFDPFLAQGVIYILLVVYCLKTAKQSGIKFYFRKPNIKMTLLCTGITLAAFPIAGLMNYIGMAFTGDMQMDVDISRPIWTLILTMAILPAVAEEIAYRGLIQGAYMKESALYSVLFSGIAFAFMHFSMGAMMYAFLYGCIFALVRIVTGNMWYSIIMHLLFNAINICTLYIGNIKISEYGLAALVIIGGVLCAIMTYLLCRNDRAKFIEQKWSAKEFISKENIIAYIICIVLTIYMN